MKILYLKKKISRTYLEDFIKKYAISGKTLDIGCGTGRYSKYFHNRIGIDIYETPAVDFITDAHDLKRFKEGEFDCILCTEVLEHLHTPQIAINEMYRVLKTNGLLILTTRFIFPLHDTPGDYYRFTKYGLIHLLSNFKIIEIKEEVNTLETFAVLLQRIGFQCVTLKSSLARIFWLILAKITKFLSNKITVEYGVYGNPDKKVQNIMTTGYYVACEKS